ncbi:MAG: rod shape-determining protein MreD [Phycisphaerae bacterium]|jgi:rod shape-determining protein MreD
MKWLLFFVIAAGLMLLNASALMGLTGISRYDIRPDLMLAVLAFFSYRYPGRDAITAAFTVGILSDISGQVMGPGMLCCLIFGVIFSGMRGLISMDTMRNRLFAIFILGLFVISGETLLSSLKSGQQAVKPLLTIPLRALYSAFAAALIWPVLDYILLIFGLRRRKR